MLLSREEIAGLSQEELRAQWSAAWGLKVPAKISREMLKQSLAFKQHQDAGLGLSIAQQRQLQKLVAAYRKNPTAPPVQRIKTGTRLVRVWQGKAYEVLVQKEGFLYDGQPYNSLSEIATRITGTAWNGWRFFGVPNPNKEKTVCKEQGGAT